MSTESCLWVEDRTIDFADQTMVLIYPDRQIDAMLPPSKFLNQLGG